MSDRLISAERLKRHYAWWAGVDSTITYDDAKRLFDAIIDTQPTAGEIIHCHECIRARVIQPSMKDGAYRPKHLMCSVDECDVPDMHFCGYADRR